MYIPASFVESDPQKLRAFIDEHGFATLVTQANNEPFASHMPLLYEEATADAPAKLIGHMARANPQWRSAKEQRALAIFQGPNAYVSPTWYEVQNSAPTWNYVAVYVLGVIRFFTDRTRLLDTVTRTVTKYERGLPEPWSVDKAEPEFIDKLLHSIVGIELTIDRLEGKWKLNQNHDEERRRRVIRVLEGSSTDSGRAIAELMKATLDGAEKD